MKQEDAILNALATTLNDVEGVRIATQNRLRALAEYEDAMSPAHLLALKAMCATLVQSEKAATLALQRAMREHQLGPWVQSTVGVGLKQAARLLAVVGDPLARVVAEDEELGTPEVEVPRSLSQLRQYCGHGGPSRHQKGVRSFWNPEAKMRVHLIAKSCLRQRHSPYRVVYDATREQYAGAIHAEPCAQCGPKGAPALPGSPLSDGHRHARGLRAMGKAILADLYSEAFALHTPDDHQSRLGGQGTLRDAA